jgi:hypothetical protein
MRKWSAMTDAVADWLSKFRVFPRLFSIFYLYGMNETAAWLMALEAPTTQQAAFATTVITVAAAWFKFYVDAGKQ